MTCCDLWHNTYVRVIVLGTLIAVGALSFVAFAQAPAAEKPKTVSIQYMPGLSNEKKLKDPFAATYSTVYLMTGGGGHIIGFESDKGMVLINTMAPGWAKAIKDKLELITQEPVTTIINTSPDAEYTGGNAEFQDAVTIAAHAKAKTAMEKSGAFKGAAAKFLPNKTFTDTLTLFEGRNAVHLYHFGAAHTGGDTVVIIPTYAAAYLGDLFPAKETPVIDTANGGSAVAFADTLARAAEILTKWDIDYVVPGKVPVVNNRARLFSRKDVQEYIDFNRDFLAAAKAAMQAGKTVDEAAATLALPDKYKAYGMTHARANIQAIYNDLKK